MDRYPPVVQSSNDFPLNHAKISPSTEMSPSSRPLVEHLRNFCSLLSSKPLSPARRNSKDIKRTTFAQRDSVSSENSCGRNGKAEKSSRKEIFGTVSFINQQAAHKEFRKLINPIKEQSEEKKIRNL